MARSSTYLCIYDISSSRTRRRISKILQGLGVRVQNSAFECHLTKGRLERLWREVQACDLAENDSVLLYHFRYPFTRQHGERQSSAQELGRPLIILS